MLEGFEEMEIGDAPKMMPLPVVIVGGAKGERTNGMTAAWVSQVSAEPPIVMVAIREKRYTWELMKETEYFGISVLGEGQEKIAGIFGSLSGRTVDKFKEAGVKPLISPEGVPLIPGSIAAFVCRKRKVVEIGDHLAVFGEVVRSWKGAERKALVWYGWKIVRM